MKMESSSELKSSDARGAYRRNILGNEVVLAMILHSPRIVLFDNVASVEECAALRQYYASADLPRSAMIDGAEPIINASRTSTNNWIPEGTNTVADKIQQRISVLTACSIKRMESLNIINYDVAQEYRSHFDYFDDVASLPEGFQKGGQRVGTFIVYLNDVKQGGFTRFPNLGLTVTPRMGAGLYFEYKRGRKRDDGLTLHTGTPVINGAKWIATTWIRESDRL